MSRTITYRYESAPDANILTSIYGETHQTSTVACTIIIVPNLQDDNKASSQKASEFPHVFLTTLCPRYSSMFYTLNHTYE